MLIKLNILNFARVLLIIFHSFILQGFECSAPRDDHLSSYRGGQCGNGEYDLFLNHTDKLRVNWKLMTEFVPLQFRRYETKSPDQDGLRNRLRRLSTEPVIVRLNVVYDSALADEYKNEADLEKHVRNLIYATQLIYEQPEIQPYIKFNFVVVGLRRSSVNYNRNLTSAQILQEFREGTDVDVTHADLNIFLAFRNLWRLDRPGIDKQSKILGLANLGVFCRRTYYRTLIINADSLGAAITLAHEICHTFNVMHDGILSDPHAKNCNGEKFIMSPRAGASKMYWSNCSLDSMINYFVSDEIFECIYNRLRISDAKPIKEYFNFAPDPSNQYRKPLPGEDTPIDAQCWEALDYTASSALTLFGKNGNEYYETCQDLYCVMGFAEFRIGPAPAGSACKVRRSPKIGKCFNAKCSFD